MHEINHLKILNNNISADFENFTINTKNKFLNNDELIYQTLEKYETQTFSIELSKYLYPNFSYYDFGQKPVAYIEEINDKVLIVSGSGSFTFSDKKFFHKKNNKLEKLDTNFDEFINHSLLKIPSKSSIKDIFFDKEYLYLSFTDYFKEDCINISILRSKVNFTFLEFEKFITLDECINYDSYLNLHSSGGRITNFKDKLIISIGEFQHRNLSQENLNYFGKILSVDKTNKKISLILRAIGMFKV